MPAALLQAMDAHAPPWTTRADEMRFVLAARDARNLLTGESATPAADRYGRDPSGWPRAWFERASAKREPVDYRGNTDTSKIMK